MEKIQLSSLEKEMISFSFDELNNEVNASKMAIAAADTAADVKEKICLVWSKIGKFIRPLEILPIAGRFIKLLASLLDSICG